MDTLVDLLHSEPARRLGWALVHFLWQGAAVAALLGIGLRLTSRRTPQARYLLACLAMLALAAAPVATFFVIRPATVVMERPAVPPPDLPTMVAVAAPAEPPPAMPEEPAPTEDRFTAPAPPHVPEPWLAPVSDIWASPTPEVSSPPSLRRPLSERVEAALPWAVAAWLAGVWALLLWHLGGWVRVRRLRGDARPLADGPDEPTWQEAALRLTDTLGLRRPVRLLRLAGASARNLAGPVVVGVLRPAVLIPASVLTGLAPWQVEAILAHELAHVRRHDYLVNLVQTGIEILMFYHPAVWWVSARLRAEREACCDEVAARVVGDGRRYAAALGALAEIAARSGPAAGPAVRRLVPGADSLLLVRIRRLLGFPSRPAARRTSVVAGVVLAALALVAVVIAARGQTYVAADIEIAESPPHGAGAAFELTDREELAALLGHFPARGRRSGGKADGETGTAITFHRADGTARRILVSHRLAPQAVDDPDRLLWSEGRGWRPVQGDLIGFMDALRAAERRDLRPVRGAAFAPLEGLADGSAEAQERQRRAVEELGLPLEVETVSTGIRLRLVPAGTFMMGASDEEVEALVGDGHPRRAFARETPQTRVTLTRPMYVGATPVTRAQWRMLMEFSESQEHWWWRWDQQEMPDVPVNLLSHGEAQEFLRRLCEREGVPPGTYRLLREAEWEYACRAGTRTRFYTGPTVADLNRAGWTTVDATRQDRDPRDQYIRSVGLLQANAWGLYDMHGNVFEWCLDRAWWPEGLPGGAVTDPAIPTPESALGRIARGGSYRNGPVMARSSARISFTMTDRDEDTGFRIMREVKMPEGDQEARADEDPALPPEPPPIAHEVPDLLAWPPDLAPVWDAEFAPLDGLAEGSAEAQAGQRRAVEELGLPLEVESAATGIRFRLVPAGTFIMGSPEAEARLHVLDGPQTQVTLTRPMYAGVFPVTQRQWERIMGSNPSHFQASGGDAPVERVSWDDARAFLARLCELEGVPEGTYRLPTEAEWEYACRAGTASRFYTGRSEADLARAGWFGSEEGNSGNTTHPVGRRTSNAWGLHDLHGNVWEWCSDRWAERLPGGAVTDPAGPDSGERRVLRGGSAYFPAGFSGSASRYRGAPALGHAGTGLRVFRTLPDSDPSGPVPPSAAAPVASDAGDNRWPDLHSPWENGLGMRFAPVPGTGVLFAVWPTRVRDFRAFVEDRANNGGYDYRRGEQPYVMRADGWRQRGWEFGWETPGFAQTDDHPVTCVSYEDEVAFCAWLTRVERAAGRIRADQAYRLPRDWEWSVAVGLNEAREGTPRSKDEKTPNVYPWNRGRGTWPPPPRAGNYAGEESRIAETPSSWGVINGYNDGHPRTSPVGSFPENAHGLYDLGGNVWEWCDDFTDGPSGSRRVLRGGSWFSNGSRALLSSYRHYLHPGNRYDGYGFRVVLGPASPWAEDSPDSD